MKRALLTTCLLMAVLCHAQLEQKDWLIGVDFGINNLANNEINDTHNWYSTYFGPVGYNIAYMISNKIAIGIKGNYSMLYLSYNDGVDFISTTGATSSHNLYSTFNYVNNKRFILGSGLSIGYTTVGVDVDDITLIGSEARFDVILADIKYIFKQKFGLNVNIYLLDSFNSLASLGIFWRL